MQPTNQEQGTGRAAVPAESLQRGYETRDVRVRVIVALVGAVILLVLGSLAGLSRLLNHYRGQAARDDRQRAALGEADPPPPRLQSSPARDYARFQEEKQRRLHSYGWVDRKQGAVRIPIERAMELVLERGLPSPLPAVEGEAPAGDGAEEAPASSTPSADEPDADPPAADLPDAGPRGDSASSLSPEEQ